MADTLVPIGAQTAATSPTLARRKDYCRELCRVIARYADDTEAVELARTLESLAARNLARRYCPGLNAAAYDTFARFGMKGGEQ